jgi:hypothetical protein
LKNKLKGWEMYTEFQSEKLKGKDNLGNPRTEMTILKWV